MGNSIFQSLLEKDHEQVVFCSDPNAQLKAIIAIHNTSLGPALGGCRMWYYASEEDAVKDALRLARGMTYKAAVAGLNLGGGKAVIIGDPKKDKTEPLFRSFGRFVEGLSGRYITAEDVGTSVKDMEWVRMETRHVTGISRSLGGSGDPSPVTAYGVYYGMRAAAQYAFGRESLAGLRIAVQGAGHVGYYLVKHLVHDGAKVIICDIYNEATKKVAQDFQVEVVNPESIYDVPCDIFAPCAMGGIINAKTLAALKCKIIAGAANNQLEDESVIGPEIKKRGIIYAPDYVINAGGLINVANEIEGYNQDRALQQAGNIYHILKRVFEAADAQNILTYQAADKLAIERINAINHLKRTYTSQHNHKQRGIS